jgi:hypothetical protein
MLEIILNSQGHDKRVLSNGTTIGRCRTTKKTREEHGSIPHCPPWNSLGIEPDTPQ